MEIDSDRPPRTIEPTGWLSLRFRGYHVTPVPGERTVEVHASSTHIAWEKSAGAEVALRRHWYPFVAESNAAIYRPQWHSTNTAAISWILCVTGVGTVTT
ncbi:hypothetical protein LA080_002007 [Diaporthe eres]|nr:hypothetical protein LA080_002007 [Diaporthe eres]